MPGDTAAFLLTGPSAAGKTTVARLLAERFPRGVHVEGDVFRRSVIAGRAQVTPEPSREALAQLRLRYRLAALVADTYFDAGFTVVMEDVIAGPLLEECADSYGAFRCKWWCSSRLGRPYTRKTSRVPGAMRTGRSSSFTTCLPGDTPRLGHWLDNSGQSHDETVDEILRLTALV